MSKLRKLATKKLLIKVFLLLLVFIAVHHLLTDTTFYLTFVNLRDSGKVYVYSMVQGGARSRSVWATFEHSKPFVSVDTTTVTSLPIKTTNSTSSPMELGQMKAKNVPVRMSEVKTEPEADNYDKNGTALPANNYNLLHVLLVTYPRSGSSFVGKLLQSPKQAFYHFEPVHYLYDYTRPKRMNRRIRTPIHPVFKAQSPQEFLYDVFRCKYSQRFMQWAEIRSSYKTLERNERYWNYCGKGKNDSKLCYNASYFKQSCSKYTMQVVKTIRINIHNVQQLLEKYKDLNLKIIHLVRDPRGTMNSRSKKPILSWCRKDISCYSPRVFCAGLESDLVQAEQLKTKYPDKYFILRYEDLCCNMYHQTEKIFKFLGFGELPQETIDFLNSHNLAILRNNTAEKENYLEPSYTTVRNSLQTAFAWRHELKFSHVKVVQRHCEVVMKNLGYFPLNRPEEMRNTSYRTIPNTTDCDSW